jgi:hypothetical protein
MPSPDEPFPLGADAWEYLTARSELEKALDRTAADAEEAAASATNCTDTRRILIGGSRRSPARSQQSITGCLNSGDGAGKRFGTGPRTHAAIAPVSVELFAGVDAVV